ncbi:two-component response regulator-like protein [Rhynchospora pubera]|uniref:Two-component response regulator-like protein n=1 Tax=Rhynchospora pubera TaxID=906938 RepID=A0AAV8GLF7_9POAL|nr:two-component response regulator-like protein [Rhynchospora pubera]
MVKGEEEEVVLMEEEREEEVNWDKYLPHMPVRVLLVEGDDSTRQIISALLRKCGYRVAAVADGMKAWDTLKDKSSKIDLVLTEVELPCLSGFGLLTMIMENDISRNIPVIMMSSHDSMSMVFKCMLKGAADFLVKPIRKNELRNLWQHVWRRQIQASGGAGTMQGSQEVNLTNSEMGARVSIQKMSVGTADVAMSEKNNELSEQRSDAQSSCTRSDVEAESKHMQNRNLKLSTNMSAQTLISEPGGAKVPSNTVDQSKHVGPELDTRQNEEHLELSLRRFEYQVPLHDQKEIEERNKLNHSNYSPFALYNGRLKVTPVATAEPTECITPVSVLNLNLTSDETQSPATPGQDKSTLHFNPIRSVPVPVPTGGFPLDQLFSSSIPMPAPESNQVTEIEEEEEMTIIPGLGDPLVEETNREMSKGVSESRSSSVSVSNVGPAIPTFHNACVGNSEGLRCLTQREIALNKFRLKRKERCFEKKVRYQSRKLLAEKRPRVKGQFVRQDQMGQEVGASNAAI